jgi:hypothetical protein
MDAHSLTPGNPHDATPPEGPDLDSLSARERELREKIEQLQDFVDHGPEREREAEEERMRTLPPPSEIIQRKREKKFMEQLSRGELKNEKRNQARSGFLLFLLILATLAIGLWIYRAVQ